MMDMLLLGPSSDSYVAIIFAITCEHIGATNLVVAMDTSKNLEVDAKRYSRHEKVFLEKCPFGPV